MASSAPKEKTGLALGTLQSSLVTGMVGGPLLGGILAHVLNYRPLFFGTAFFCFAGAVIVLLLVREDFVPGGEKDRSTLGQNIRTVIHNRLLRNLLFLLISVQVATVIIAPFLSLFVEHLKVPSSQVALMTGIVFGITGISNAAFAPFWGKKTDQMGSGKVLRRSLLGIMIFSLPQALVTNIRQLIILRCGLGVFFSGVIPTINTMVKRIVPPQNQGGIYGIFQGGLLIGNMSGPLVGGILAAYLGLRWIFLISSGIFFSAFLGITFVFPEGNGKNPDLPGVNRNSSDPLSGGSFPKDA